MEVIKDLKTDIDFIDNSSFMINNSQLNNPFSVQSSVYLLN
jgi:hypothetical protein